VKSLPLFKGCDESFLSSVTRAIKPVTLLKGWYIFRKGEDANEMYFIREGEVEVCSEDGKIVFVTLRSGAFFGEIAILQNCTRTASVRASKTSDLCFLTREDFSSLCASYPSVDAQIKQTVEERLAADRKREEA
ncbi:cyclic nucleotide-binding-like protein, partial [Blyttiomyces helicus]